MFIAINKYAFRGNSIKNRVYYCALELCCSNNKKPKQEARK